MNLVGLENVTLHEGVFEFKIYEYNDEIDLSDKESHICDLKVILLKVNPMFIDRIGKSIDTLALISSLNSRISKQEIIQDIKEFIFNEICEENLEKENIDVMFIES